MRIKLVHQKLSYSLTWQGWIFIIGFNSLLVFFVLRYIATFLVVNKPLQTEILIVDGILPGYGYDSVVKLISDHGYKYVITTGVDMGYTFRSENVFNGAEFSYKILSEKDITNCKLDKAPARNVKRDRTFTSALELKKWFIKNRIYPEKINIISFSCHARRTWIMYKKAFVGFADIGIITIDDNTYDYNKWYKNSKGVRMILSESIGYIYSTVFFHPKINQL